MKFLKTILIIGGLIFSVSTYAQHEHRSATTLLKDKTMQDSIMMVISNDPEMRENMMKHMIKNKRAMQDMVMNKEMMKEMMKTAGEDSSMCRSMMSMMMENKNMHQMMMGMMDKNSMSKGYMKKDSTTNKNQNHNH